MSRPLTDGKREFNWAALAQVSIYGLALLLAKLVGLATLPIFTSFLSPADYGRLEVLQTLANLVSLVLAFGLTEALFKFVARETDPGRRQELLGTIWTLALAGAAVSAVVLQILAPWIHAVLPGGVALLDTRIILASLSVGALILVPLAYLRMTDRPWAYFFGSAGRAAIQALLAIALLSAGWGLTGVLIAGLICAMGLAAWLCVFMLRQVRTTFMRQDAGAMLHFGGTIVLAGGAIFIVDTFDRWLLAGAIGPAELGRYAVAAKVGVLVSFALQPFLMWWLPRRFAVLNEPGGLVQSARMSELAIVLTCLAVVATASGAPFLIALMTPAAYHGAIVYVPAVAILAALNSASHLVDTGCLRPERTTWPIRIDGVAAVVALVGYVSLIPILGAWGAIIATAAALSWRLAAYWYFGRRYAAIPYRLGASALVVTATLICTLAIAVTPGVFVPLLIGVVAGLVLIVSSWLLDLFPPQVSAVLTAWWENRRNGPAPTLRSANSEL